MTLRAVFVATAVVCGALLTAPSTVATGPVTGRPTPPTSVADGSATTAADRLMAGGNVLAVGLGSVWAATADDEHSTEIWRIDPQHNKVRRVRTLQLAGGGLGTGYGSLWVTDYYGNAVWRLSPAGRVEDRIATGLQPESIHVAFGSVWVGNHHGSSLTRIDPATDRVIATDAAGDPTLLRSGPQSMTHDAHRLYVGSSNLPQLQWIAPTTNRTTTSPSRTYDSFCGRLTLVSGYIWDADECTDTLYQHRTNGSTTGYWTYASGDATDAPAVLDTAVLAGHLWVSGDRHDNLDAGIPLGGGFLEERNPRTGSIVRTISLGGDAQAVVAGYGSLWVSDGIHHVVRRVTPAATATGPAAATAARVVAFSFP